MYKGTGNVLRSENNEASVTECFGPQYVSTHYIMWPHAIFIARSRVKNKKHKCRVKRKVELIALKDWTHTQKGCALLQDLSLTVSPLPIMHTWILTCHAELSISDCFHWATDTRRAWSFTVSLFPIPVWLTLCCHDVTSFKCMFTYWPPNLVVGKWITSSSLNLSHTPQIHLHTHTHTDTHLYMY